MYRLLIDSSTKLMYIGLTYKDKLIDETLRIAKRDHSKYIVEKINILLKNNNVDIKQLKEIIVGSGPGSYTGLRVSITVCKMLAWTLKIKLKEVSSLFFLTSGYEGLIMPMLDARNNRYYYSVYKDIKTLVRESVTELKLIETNKYYNISNKINITSETYKINPIKIIKKANKIRNIHGFKPKYLQKTQAEREFKTKKEER